MRRERLKDQIGPPRVTAFDSLMKGVLALAVAAGAYMAISEISRPPHPAAIPAPAVCPCGLSIAADPQVILTATKDRCFYWNNQGPIPLDHFAAHFALWLKAAKAPSVVIAADASAQFGDALALLQEARRQGVANAQIEARARPNP